MSLLFYLAGSRPSFRLLSTISPLPLTNTTSSESITLAVESCRPSMAASDDRSLAVERRSLGIPAPESFSAAAPSGALQSWSTSNVNSLKEGVIRVTLWRSWCLKQLLSLGAVGAVGRGCKPPLQLPEQIRVYVRVIPVLGGSDLTAEISSRSKASHSRSLIQYILSDRRCAFLS